MTARIIGIIIMAFGAIRTIYGLTINSQKPHPSPDEPVESLMIGGIIVVVGIVVFTLGKIQKNTEDKKEG